MNNYYNVKCSPLFDMTLIELEGTFGAFRKIVVIEITLQACKFDDLSELNLFT